MIAPAMAPAMAPIWNFCALVALAVPWRSSTWASSWAMTPTTSPSAVAASNMPAVDEHRAARAAQTR